MSEVRDEETMLAIAKQKGCTVVWPREDELFIDIDSQLGSQQFTLSFLVLQELYPNAKLKRNTPSISRKPYHRHIVVSVGEALTAEKRILLQALLGSDLMREMLALKHLRDGHPPTVFFEKQETDPLGELR